VISSWSLSLFNYQDDVRSNKHKMESRVSFSVLISGESVDVALAVLHPLNVCYILEISFSEKCSHIVRTSDPGTRLVCKNQIAASCVSLLQAASSVATLTPPQ